jgi:hypothetical protein
MKDWKFLSGDINWEDHGGSWCLKRAGVWWVLKFKPKTQEYQNFCEVLMVDLKEISQDTINEALRSCGWEFNDRQIEEVMILSALVDYGSYAPMGFEESAYPMRCRAAVRRYADELMKDKQKLEKTLERPINAMGSTAIDFMKDDALAGLRRKAEKVIIGGHVELNDADKMMLGMYAASEGQTIGGDVEVELAVAGEMVKNG